MKLNVGCGTKIFNDYINIDIGIFKLDDGKIIEPEILCNLDNGLPFEDNIVEYIYADNVIEHLKEPFYFMEECHRVLKEKGKVRIITPHFKCHSSYHCPDHKYHFGELTIHHFTPIGFHIVSNKVYNKFLPLPTKRILSSWYFPCSPTTIDFTLQKTRY